MHDTGFVFFFVLDNELVRVNDHGGPVVIGIDAEVQDRQAGIHGDQQPVPRVYAGVTYRGEHLLAQEQRHQPAQATPLCGIEVMTGRRVSKRLREVGLGNQVLAQITAAPPLLIPGNHNRDSCIRHRLGKKAVGPGTGHLFFLTPGDFPR